MVFRKNVIIAILITLSQIIFPQTDQQATRKINFPTSKPGHIYSAYGVRDSVIKSDIDMTEMINVIVEFKDEPLFLQMKEKGLAKGNLSAFKARQAQLSSSVTQLYQAAQKAYKAEMKSPVVTREFYKLFNGCSMTIPRAILADIAELDYVKKVHPARNYHVNLKESVKIIGADKVWADYGNKGDSVVVGIIDTGIDYLHPALGGGFGKGFKVIGGYDYYNNDNDPMDDNDHGTHVAGIVAGNNNVIKGVAPNAFLMAFKVLNSSGNGEDKNVLAGIEGAVDPNNDNNFEDKVDIANMSLGDNNGNGEDPVSIAVNNAVKLGVVFCVAAGNSGGYNTIGSPAGASEAITVAASTKADLIASFSSKGPANETFSLKPDIAAPGVQIYSSVRGNNYANYDGTSMASPMVAGVCALLKRQHKDWTPQMIKSALMSTARDIGSDAMSQGAGRVQADKAMTVSSFSYPASISFGLDNLEQNIWTKKETIKISNYSSLAQNYNVTISGASEGISINPDISGFNLLPGQSKDVIFSLQVNNNLLKDSYQPHCSFMGKVKISGSKDTLNIPWAFSRYAFLSLNFNKPVLDFMVMSHEDNFLVYDTARTENFTKCKMTVPPGTYRIWVQFAKLTDLNNGEGELAIIMKNNISISGNKELNISSEEAVNKINFNGVDENGRLLKDGENTLNNMVFQLTDRNYYQGWAFNIKLWSMKTLGGKMSVKISNTDDTVWLAAGQVQSSLINEKKIRVIQYPLTNGIHSDLNLTNKPSDFLKQNIQVTLPPQRKDIVFSFCNIIISKNMAMSMDLGNGYVSDRNWNGQMYITKETDINNVFSTSPVYHSILDTAHLLNIEPGIFRTSSDSVAFVSDIISSILNPKALFTFYPANSNFIFGNGVIYPQEEFWRFKDGSLIYFQFKGMFDEVRGADPINTTVQIYDKNDKLVYSELMSNKKLYGLPDDKYKFVIKNSNYAVDGIPGLATLIMDMQYKQTGSFGYCSHPIFLSITDSKRNTVTKLSKGEEGYLSFKYPSTPSSITSYKVFAKRYNAQNWEEVKNIALKEISGGTQFTVNLKDFTNIDSGKVDIKISFTNNSNLTTDWILEPAFTVGNFITSVETDSIKTAPLPKQYMLYSNYPNPFNPSTVISYALPRSSNVTLKVYDMMGREVTTLVNKTQEAGHHTVQFDASKLSSGVYFYSIKAEGFLASRKMLLIK